MIAKQETQKPQVQPQPKRKTGGFKKFLSVIFVQDWGLKVLSLVFATIVWVLFKISV